MKKLTAVVLTCMVAFAVVAQINVEGRRKRILQCNSQNESRPLLHRSGWASIVRRDGVVGGFIGWQSRNIYPKKSS